MPKRPVAVDLRFQFDLPWGRRKVCAVRMGSPWDEAQHGRRQFVPASIVGSAVVRFPGRPEACRQACGGLYRRARFMKRISHRQLPDLRLQ